MNGFPGVGGGGSAGGGGGGLSSLGGALGSIFGAWSARSRQKRAFRHAKWLQHDQQKWLEGMSSTAVQRRMADLHAAGINPVLAGRWEASTPGMGTASGTSSSATSPDWTQSLLAKETRKLIKAQTEAATASAQQSRAMAEFTGTKDDAMGAPSQLGRIGRAILKPIADFAGDNMWNSAVNMYRDLKLGNVGEGKGKVKTKQGDLRIRDGEEVTDFFDHDDGTTTVVRYKNGKEVSRKRFRRKK